MPVVQVVASRAGAGKSTVLVGLAQGFAAEGRRVRIERIGAGAPAEADADTFAQYLFAASSGRPVEDPPDAPDGEVLLVEMDASSDIRKDLQAILAVYEAPSAADATLAASLGDSLVGSIATSVDPAEIEAAARDMTNAGLRPLALIPEHAGLAAPSVLELGNALGATVLYEADNADEVVEDVIIGPVYADPARPLFRRYAHKAILAPFNKTDLHLAAIETEASCLVITGGEQPSPYILDRAQHGTTTLLLSPNDTPATVAMMGTMWSSTRFRGGTKAQAAYDALRERLDFRALLAKLTG